MTFRRVTGVRWVLAALLAGGALAPTSAGRATTPPDTAPGLADAAATTGSDESTAPPPSGSAPNTTTTLAPLVYADGLFTSPDGTFTAAFDAAPSRVLDTENGLASYLLGVDEDTQSIVMFSGGAFGAGQRASPTERADRFLEASGIDIERLANSPTRLGPFPAGHFVAKLTLGDERRAAVYGLVVDRLATIGDVLYAFYTDVGLDDNGAARAFVGSFELRFDVLPAPPPTTTTPTTLPLPVATTPRATGGAPSSVAPADVDTATIPAVTTATAAATTSTEAPMPAVPPRATTDAGGSPFPRGSHPSCGPGPLTGSATPSTSPSTAATRCACSSPRCRSAPNGLART